MERQTVVTIGRYFGSNGRNIGEKLAEELELPCYDRNLLGLMAEKSGVEWKTLTNADEKLLRWTDDLGIGNSSDNPNEQLFRIQSEIIKGIVKKGESCVFVGRLADYVLRNRPNVLKVFIYAPMEERIETVMKRYEFKRDEAERVIRRIDKTRKQYYEYFSGRQWDQKEGRMLMLDSSIFGIDGCVEIIKKAVAEQIYFREW